MTTASSALSLIYVGDPMCSWCYGFGVPLGQLLERFPEVPVQLVLGGLRAYNTQVMDTALKDKLRNAWAGVAQRSGQPFSQALFEREDFIYDTGRDVTKAAVLAGIRDEVHGRSKEAWGHIDFLRDFESDAMRQQTREDFAQAQRWGIRGFSRAAGGA